MVNARKRTMALVRSAALGGSLLLALGTGSIGLANVPVTQLSSDAFINPTSQHRTEVEPDTFAFGSTMVSVVQAGRFFDGGSSGIAWATSRDTGSTWKNGVLPGITTFSGGPFDRASDPSVAFDARHNVWLAASLALTQTGGVRGVAVLVSRSIDGGLTWGNPVTVKTGADLDKDWIVCDDTSTSPFFGNCYTQWDDHGNGNLIQMSTSSDGGLTWGPAKPTADLGTGLGGQPLVQPNGTVIVPLADAFETSIRAFRSTDGGGTWGSTVLVSTIISHAVAGGLRSGPLPSAEIDGAGTVAVVWHDCRFRPGCSANDIVASVTSNGLVWSPVGRVPLVAPTSAVDLFIPGVAIDRSTAGGSAHVGITFYLYPNANCTATTCQLLVGFAESINGGTSWGAAVLEGPMSLSWLANTNQGRMVGDYISTSFMAGIARPAFALARAPSGATFNEGLFTTTTAVRVAAAPAPNVPGRGQTEQQPLATDQAPVQVTRSDHATPTSPLTSR